MKARCSTKAKEYSNLSREANSSWTDIFASFPELHGMLTGQLNLPAIFRPSFDGNYRNAKNLNILQLLKLHAATLPGILGKGEIVSAIIPGKLQTFTFVKWTAGSCPNALIITTSRVLMSLKCFKNSPEHGWIELDPKGFFDSLSSQIRKTDIELNLLGGYKLVLQYVPSTIQAKTSGYPESDYCGLHRSNIKTADHSAIIHCRLLCPVCLKSTSSPPLKVCPHCRTKFSRLSTAALQSALLPGLPEYRCCANRHALLHIAFSLILLASLAQSVITSDKSMLLLSSLLVMINHGLSVFHSYKISALFGKPKDSPPI